ncbi:MAG TPA: ABC transporter ATP-binding protein [Chloroflexia bacterium]|nr:ABC transporter ATP-binding protein [Chloroflexia bacterium]
MDETGPYRRTILRATGVTKHYGDLVALGGVDFEVPRHGIVSLIGPNGAGKTVFFNILTGLTKPDSGTIWFNGESTARMSPDRVTALGMARTFQNIRLFEKMTVLENVMVGRHCRMKRGIWGAVMRSPDMMDEESQAYELSLDLLHFVGLDGVMNRYAGSLPYGLGRRLEIARALATSPQLLLLDEPTAGMNPQETAALQDLISRVRAELGITVLLIEHDMKVVMRISDRVSVLDYGRMIAEGSPEDIRNDARVIEAYLGRGAAARRDQSGTPGTAPGVDPQAAGQMHPRPVVS